MAVPTSSQDFFQKPRKCVSTPPVKLATNQSILVGSEAAGKEKALHSFVEPGVADLRPNRVPMTAVEAPVGPC